MAIDVGDAVFTFLADTSQLDKAYAKVNAGTETAVKPATAAIENMNVVVTDTGIQVQKLGNEAAVTGKKMLEMGSEGAAAGEEMAFSMHEAKGELALVGEATGITIPRHIRSFVAELPGVGKALEAAFSATAVFFLIQILGEAAAKLSEFIADKVIYTEKMKEEYNAQVALNKVIDEQTIKLAELKRAYDLIGKEGSAKTGVEISRLTKEYEILTQQMADYNRVINLAKDGYAGMAEEAEEATLKALGLDKTMATLKQQLLNLLKEFDDQTLAESIKRRETIINAEKTTAEGVAALQYQAQRIKLIQQNASYSELIAAQKAFDDKQFEIERSTIAQKIANLRNDPTRNANALIALHAELEALDLAHHTKLLAQYNDYLVKLKAAAAKGVVTVVDTFELIENPAGEMLDRIKQDFAALGITGVLPLTEQLQAQQKAYDDLKASGLASANDIKRADIALLQTKIALHKQQGDDTKEEEKELQKLIEQYNALMGVQDKLRIKQFDLFKMWRAEIPTASKAWKDLVDLGKLGLNEFARAAEAAFASAILSESSFGDALRKGTAQVLAEIAARSLVYAVFYTALGFARLAEYDFVGATNAFTAAGIYGAVGAATAVAAYAINPKEQKTQSGAPIAGTALEPQTISPTQQPIVITQNVPRLTSGGLVNQQSVALIGERSRAAKASSASQPETSGEIESREGGGGGNVFIHVEGLISPDNLVQVVKKIDRSVNSGRARLTSNNSFRVTKKA